MLHHDFRHDFHAQLTHPRTDQSELAAATPPALPQTVCTAPFARVCGGVVYTVEVSSEVIIAGKPEPHTPLSRHCQKGMASESPAASTSRIWASLLWFPQPALAPSSITACCALRLSTSACARSLGFLLALHEGLRGLRQYRQLDVQHRHCAPTRVSASDPLPPPHEENAGIFFHTERPRSRRPGLPRNFLPSLTKVITSIPRI